MSSGKLFVGVVAAAAAGVMLGMLFAPRKGSATRKLITRTGEEYAEDAKNKFSEYIDAVTEDYDTFKEGTADWVGKGKKKIASGARTNHSK